MICRGRESRSCLVRVFKFKLGHVALLHNKCTGTHTTTSIVEKVLSCQLKNVYGLCAFVRPRRFIPLVKARSLTLECGFAHVGSSQPRQKWLTMPNTLACSSVLSMRLCHPPEHSTSPKYKLLCFITTKKICKEKNALAFNWYRCCHLVLCLQLIHVHYLGKKFCSNCV
jgi:hypothetical protein